MKRCSSFLLSAVVAFAATACTKSKKPPEDPNMVTIRFAPPLKADAELTELEQQIYSALGEGKKIQFTLLSLHF